MVTSCFDEGAMLPNAAQCCAMHCGPARRTKLSLCSAMDCITPHLQRRRLRRIPDAGPFARSAKKQK
jgi:hypothetical protein